MQNGDYINKINELKANVKKFLMEKDNFTEKHADEIIKIYSDDFPEFLDNDWSLAAIAAAMIMGY